MGIADIISLKSLSDLNPTELSEFISLLISNEIQPGGPYTFDGQDDETLNNKIRSLIEESHQHSTKLTQPIETSLWNNAIIEARTFLPKNSLASKQFNKLYKKLLQTDTVGEISLLNRTFYDSLKPCFQQKYPQLIKQLINLDKANVHTWLSYSIYDRILDDKKYVELLPLANHLHSRSLSYYHSVAFSLSSEKALNCNSATLELFALTNKANVLEFEQNNAINILLNPNKIYIYRTEENDTLFKSLSNRSIIHCTGPALITNFLTDSPTMHENISEAFSQYCAARQLLDDLHDWRDDLKNGRMTYVIAALFEEENLHPAIYDIDDLLSTLSKCFFESTAKTLLKEVESLAMNAQTTLENTHLRKDSPFTASFITPLIITAQKALEMHQFNHQFLKVYPNNQPHS